MTAEYRGGAATVIRVKVKPNARASALTQLPDPAAHQKLTTARDGTREVRICVGDVQSRFRVFG